MDKLCMWHLDTQERVQYSRIPKPPRDILSNKTSFTLLPIVRVKNKKRRKQFIKTSEFSMKLTRKKKKTVKNFDRFLIGP